MKKPEILEKLRALPFDPDEYWLAAGAAMVLHGLREESADIDLGCTPELADRLEAAGCPFRRTQDGNRWFKHGGEAELFENWLCGTVETIDGVPVVSLPGLLEMKERLGREKDRKDIELIRKALGR